MKNNVAENHLVYELNEIDICPGTQRGWPVAPHNV
jgi:hypothetical protein